MYADVIFTGAFVYTQDPENPRCNTIAAKGGVIQAAGSADLVDSLSDENTQIVDLSEMFVLPGFIGTDSVLPSACFDLSDDEEIGTDLQAQGYTTIFIKNAEKYGTALYENERIPQRFLFPEDAAGSVPAAEDDPYSDTPMHGPHEEIDKRTVTAADRFGINSLSGSLKPGRYADLAVFSEDPFKFRRKKNAVLPEVALLVINGETVYDAEAEVDMEWYRLMASQQL
ncbi:MAG: hypothetical protein VB031_02955 [Eubacteriaceae bacterium]|nr:hypothetical protein [Eubacteriaceae bacterium]